MRYQLWSLFAVCVGVAAQAQIINPPSIDPSVVANAVAAATPAPCPTPASDTLIASAGTQPVCMTRPDATRATQVQRGSTITTADAGWSLTFDTPFATAPTYVDARIYGTTQPYLCTVTSISATGASGKCFQLIATTLPTVATSLLGLTVSPIQTAGAGLPVRVIARL